MSKHFAQQDRLTLYAHKNSIMFGMLLISLIHNTDTERNMTCKDRKTVTRNSEYTDIVVTLKLRPAQQLMWQQLHNNFSGSLRSIPEVEHDLFPTVYFKLVFMNYHITVNNMMFVNNNVVKYTTGK